MRDGGRYGLGILAGAVLCLDAGAQRPVGRDTLTVRLPPRADSILKRDSSAAVPLPIVPKPDTIKAPLARGEQPPVFDIGAPRIYDRAALFATGALTLTDLLGRLPGLTELTTGGLAAPAVIASQGDLRRVRLFLDGLELDPMDLRARGTAPANDLALYDLEAVRIERGAEEVRVYATTWRVDRTVAYTRADILTGDQNTNLYRGFFGRRYEHGEALQLAAEQSSSQTDRNLAASDAQRLMARIGLTRGPWATDLYAERADRSRGKTVGTGGFSQTRDTIPGVNARRTTAYARVANGDPDAPRWMQLMASAMAFRGSAQTASALFGTPVPGDKAIRDSSTYESQYLLTGGVRRGAARLSGAERVRVSNGRRSHVGSARGSYETDRLSVSLFGEGNGTLHPSRSEANVRLAPLPRIAATLSVSRTGGGTFDRIFTQRTTIPVLRDGVIADQPADDQIGNDSTPIDASRFLLASRTNARAELGIKVRDLWVSAGLIRRGATTLLPPSEFDTLFQRRPAIAVEQMATARTVALRGRLFKGVNLDAWAVAWGDSAGLYRPKYQTRSELYIRTSLEDRFPRRDFDLLASLTHEYRSNTKLQVTKDSIRTAPGFRTLAFKLEIRVLSAVVSYQFRNLLQERYAEVPGLSLPRQTQIYGVRWEFWN